MSQTATGLAKMDSAQQEDLIIETMRGDVTCEGLGDDDDGGVHLEGEERTFKPNWKVDAGGYLRVEDVGHQLQKNVRDNVKESWKNRLLRRNQLLRYFLPNLTNRNLTIWNL